MKAKKINQNHTLLTAYCLHWILTSCHTSYHHSSQQTSFKLKNWHNPTTRATIGKKRREDKKNIHKKRTRNTNHPICSVCLRFWKSSKRWEIVHVWWIANRKARREDLYWSRQCSCRSSRRPYLPTLILFIRDFYSSTLLINLINYSSHSLWFPSLWSLNSTILRIQNQNTTK